MFKNNAPFKSCISKINGTLIGNAENLDIVMLMYNLCIILTQPKLFHDIRKFMEILQRRETKLMLMIMIQMVKQLNIKQPQDEKHQMDHDLKIQEMQINQKKNNLDYLIDPTFRNIDRLFVLSFKNCDDDRTINYFDEYYMLLVQIKIFQALIDNKPLFDQPVKNKQEVYKKPVKRSINNDYTTGNLSDYLHHQKYYKHIGVDLS